MGVPPIFLSDCVASASAKDGLATRSLYLRDVTWFVEERRTGPPSQEGRIVRRWQGLALLHVDGDGMGGRDACVILVGSFHSNLVLPLAETFNRSVKTPLIDRKSVV